MNKEILDNIGTFSAELETSKTIKDKCKWLSAIILNIKNSIKSYKIEWFDGFEAYYKASDLQFDDKECAIIDKNNGANNKVVLNYDTEVVYDCKSVEFIMQNCVFNKIKCIMVE